MNIEKQNANSVQMLEKCGGRCRPSRSIVSGSRRVGADRDALWPSMIPFSLTEGLTFSAISLGLALLGSGAFILTGLTECTGDTVRPSGRMVLE